MEEGASDEDSEMKGTCGIVWRRYIEKLTKNLQVDVKEAAFENTIHDESVVKEWADLVVKEYTKKSAVNENTVVEDIQWKIK